MDDLEDLCLIAPSALFRLWVLVVVIIDPLFVDPCVTRKNPLAQTKGLFMASCPVLGGFSKATTGPLVVWGICRG